MESSWQTVEHMLTKLGAGRILTGKALNIIRSFITGKHSHLIDTKVFLDAHLLALCEKGKNSLQEGCSITDNIQRLCFTDSNKRSSALFR